MSHRDSRGVWDTLVIAAVALLSVTCAHAQWAAAQENTDDAHQEGRIVELSPEGDGRALGDAARDEARDEQGEDDERQQAEEQQEPAPPAYWLGIHGQPLDSAVLRTHLQLADGVGVVVEEIVPDSPAEKAGLRRHDILLDVGGEQIADMMTLQTAVAASEGKSLQLKVIRLAKEMTLQVTPEKRPANLAAALPRSGVGSSPLAEMERMIEQLQQGQLPAGVRVFGPGAVINGHRAAAGLPRGVRVSITREGDGPATVTVTRGDETWTVQGDDAEALAKLPADVQAFVKQMLASEQRGGIAGAVPGLGGISGMLPNNLGQFELDFQTQADEANRELSERMEQLEAQLERVQEQLEKRAEQNQ
ncbi:MAG TPA: PDZ domain-containing protein [Lacipirellulaceae bacterium]|nr:PDZ domain-containing protein [Lacipirellulaceae bacterium]